MEVHLGHVVAVVVAHRLRTRPLENVRADKQRDQPLACLPNESVVEVVRKQAAAKLEDEQVVRVDQLADAGQVLGRVSERAEWIRE